MQYTVHVPTGMAFEAAREHWTSMARANGLVTLGEPTVMRQGPVLRIEGDVEALASA